MIVSIRRERDGGHLAVVGRPTAHQTVSLLVGEIRFHWRPAGLPQFDVEFDSAILIDSGRPMNQSHHFVPDWEIFEPDWNADDVVEEARTRDKEYRYRTLVGDLEDLD
jgi:hypothetical protein